MWTVRDDQDDDPAAHRPESPFGVTEVLEVLDHPGEGIPAQVLADHLPAPQGQGQLQLVAPAEELPGLAELDLVVVFLDPGLELDLLEPPEMLLFLVLLLPLVQFVFVFSVIENPADGRD